MIDRRQVLKLTAGALAISPLGMIPRLAFGQDLPLIQRPIPSTGELVPAIGMGTSRTFDKRKSPIALLKLSTLVKTLIASQGTIIDTSPSYGQAESRVGDVLRSLGSTSEFFTATKVSIEGKEAGIAQMEQSAKLMNVERFDLIAIHNLTDWKTHIETLKQWREEGKVRYIGITTSHSRDHEEFAEIMRTEPVDFAQFSYSLGNRQAEEVLLPLAAEQGIATMINRPFQQGDLFKRVRGEALPKLAADLDCTSWAQFFLKFVLGHPAATCAIPATSKAHHMSDNMAANFGRVPNAEQRLEMIQVLETL